MRKILAALVVLWGLGGGAVAQTQSVLPQGMAQFTDGNGKPYAGGKVYMYIPSTTTLKATYQDPYAHVANANPATLDANGRGVFWGSGLYRQVLQDARGVVVWDQLTQAAASTTAAGVMSIWFGAAAGTANAITLASSPSFNGTDGQVVGFVATATNTGSATINASGYGSVLVQKNTSGGLGVLVGGEIDSGNTYYATYVSGSNSFVLQGTTPVATTSFLATGVTGTADAYVVGGTTPSGWLPMAGNTLILTPPAVPNTTAVTVKVSGVTYPVVKVTDASTALVAGDTSTFTTVAMQLLFNGTSFQVVNPAVGTVPVGAVMPFALGACPAGWAAADGTGGTVNMLGVVVRGYDPGGTRDPAGPAQSVGSYQADQFQDHYHSAPSGQAFIIGALGGAGITATSPSNYAQSGGATTTTASSGNHGVETRVKSTILLFCQKL